MPREPRHPGHRSRARFEDRDGGHVAMFVRVGRSLLPLKPSPDSIQRELGVTVATYDRNAISIHLSYSGSPSILCRGFRALRGCVGLRSSFLPPPKARLSVSLPYPPERVVAHAPCYHSTFSEFTRGSNESTALLSPHRYSQLALRARSAAQHTEERPFLLLCDNNALICGASGS